MLLLVWLCLRVAMLESCGAPGKRKRSPREKALDVLVRVDMLHGPGSAAVLLLAWLCLYGRLEPYGTPG